MSLSIYLSNSLSFSLSIYLSNFLSLSLSLSLSLFLSLYLSISRLVSQGQPDRISEGHQMRTYKKGQL